MATKVKTGVIDAGAITSALITDASITADDLHTTLDLTGKTVTVATASASDNDTSVASTAYVTTAIANLADSAPSTLNTLNELAAALGDDANFSTTVTNSIAAKLPLAGGTLTGTLNGVAANFSSEVRISGWLTGASATNTLYSGNSTGTIIQTPSNTNNAAGSFYIRDSLGVVHFTLNLNTNVSTFAGTIDSGAITSSGVVTATGTDTQQYRLLQGTATAGGMFKERTITGAGVSNDVSIFAESITDGGEIHFMTGGSATKRVTIDSSGFVGIGTEDPYGRLELKGNGNGWSLAPGIRMWDSTNSKGWFVGTANNLSPGDFYIRTLPSISGNPGATEREFTIKHTTGFVGIGTYSPGAKLEISGKDDAGASDLLRLQFDNSPGDTGITFTDINSTVKNRITMDSTNTADLRISSGTKIHLYGGTTNGTSSPHLTVSNNGNVGIGTGTPQTKLDINGNIVARGDLFFGTDPSNTLSTVPNNTNWHHIGYAGGANYHVTASVQGDMTIGVIPGTGITFGTVVAGEPVPLSRMRITPNGEVKVPGTLHSPGHVIQTVYAQSASLVVPSQTINDYITLIQVNITPKYATSKILINGIAAVNLSGGNYPAIHARIYRDSTLAKQYQYWGYEGPTNTHRILNEPVHYLDSPTTTSALTYYVKIANTSGSTYTGTYTARGNSYNASTITVQEIAQ